MDFLLVFTRFPHSVDYYLWLFQSSLLQSLLGEMNITSGASGVSGTVSYAPQEPWVFSGSVRQNILFGREMDGDRYARTVRACALEPDLDAWAHGDHTLVGEKGVALSGGQKARVSLARAVYREADVYLLDDPLSAVDARVVRHLFHNCIRQVSNCDQVVSTYIQTIRNCKPHNI